MPFKTRDRPDDQPSAEEISERLRTAAVDADGFLVNPEDILLWFHRSFHLMPNGPEPSVTVVGGRLVVVGDAALRTGVKAVSARGERGCLSARFASVAGNFSLNDVLSDLTSLQGCPETVSGYFGCYGQSRLTNLMGGPRIVGTDFRVISCGLLDCSGGPDEVGGEFDVSGNNIESLVGGPVVVGSLNACNNRLTNLVGGPHTLHAGGRAPRYLVHGNPLDPENGLDGLMVDGKTEGGVFCFPVSVKKQIERHVGTLPAGYVSTLDSSGMQALMMGVARAALTEHAGFGHCVRTGRSL